MRKNMKKLTVATVIGAMTVTALAPVSAQAKDKTLTVAIWDNGQKAGLQEIMDEFTKETGIKTELQVVEWSSYWTLLEAGASGGDMPDVFWMHSNEAVRYMSNDILLDLTDKIADSDKLEMDKFPEDIKEMYQWDGKTYAVPKDIDTIAMWYNKDMFEEHGWEIPTTWDELMSLCEEIQSEGILPFYFGFRDTWTCLAPWNSIAVDLAPADLCRQVNKGEANFTDEYREAAEKYLALMEYGPDDPIAYGYNDACTAFARGESAMYPIGSYAVPQILSVNPDMNIDSFVMPASDNADENTLNSGIDLGFCVTEACENKEAAYEVLDFLLEDENIQAYIDDQNAVPCKEGDFQLASMLDGMSEYIESGNMTDYQDHYYPSEMAVDAILQTFVIDKDVDGFLQRFDTDWQRYNRDIIRQVQEYEEENGSMN